MKTKIVKNFGVFARQTLTLLTVAAFVLVPFAGVGTQVALANHNPDLSGAISKNNTGDGSVGNPFTEKDKVPICHSTGSGYSTPNPSLSSFFGVGGGGQGHDQDEDDIIPPFHYDLNDGSGIQSFDGTNWKGDFITVWNNGGCDGVVPEIDPEVDLEITKTADNETPNEGDTVTYTIEVTNNGPDEATNVVVTDTVPTGTIFVEAVPEEDSQGPLTWTFVSIASGDTENITVEVTVDSETSGEIITNTAEATADEADTDETNNSVEEDITVQEGDEVDYCDPSQKPGGMSIAEWLEANDVDGSECFDYEVVNSCGSLDVQFIQNDTPYDYEFRYVIGDQTPDLENWEGDGVLPVNFNEDENSGSIEVTYYVTGPEKDYFTGFGIPNIWEGNGETLAVDTDCEGDEGDQDPDEDPWCAFEGEVIETTADVDADQNDGDPVDPARRDVSNVEDGPASYANFGGSEGGAWSTDDFFSLGIEGYLVYEFTNGVALDQAGDDIAIYEITGGDTDTEEKIEVEVSENGTDWVSLGTFTGDASVDIAPAGLSFVKFVRLTDDSAGIQGDNGDGYDVDAIVILNGSCGEQPLQGEIHGTKFDNSTQNPLPGWTINLYEDTGEELVPITSTTTMTDDPETNANEEGMFWFTELPAGDYLVCEEMQNGWTQVLPTEGEGNPVCETEGTVGWSFSLVEEQPVTDIDFWNEEEQTQCELVDIEIFSDEQTQVNGGNATPTYDGHTAWTASIPGATWIWESFLADTSSLPQTLTFSRTFNWSADANIDATLEIATDNGYVVRINGSEVVDASGDSHFSAADQDSIDVSSFLNEGENTIEFDVTNFVGPEDPESNPAGLLYSLTAEGENCETPEPPEEPDEPGDNNDGGGGGVINRGGGSEGGRVQGESTVIEVEEGEPEGEVLGETIVTPTLPATGAGGAAKTAAPISTVLLIGMIGTLYSIRRKLVKEQI